MVKFHQLPIRFLYRYNETFKQWLFQYKGLLDYELRSIFMEPFIYLLNHQFAHHLFIPAPSANEHITQRGFNHLESMLDYFHFPWLNLIQKSTPFKQSDLSEEERRHIYAKLLVKDGERVRGRHVVLFDDVFSTGSTLMAMHDLLLPYQPKSMTGLILAENPKNSFWK